MSKELFIFMCKKVKCKWCGKLFIKKHNREMYCSDKHRKYARQEQYRTNSMNYYQKFKNILNEKQKHGLGSGLLSKYRHDSFDDEKIAIENELKRLKIK